MNFIISYSLKILFFLIILQAFGYTSEKNTDSTWLVYNPPVHFYNKEVVFTLTDTSDTEYIWKIDGVKIAPTKVDKNNIKISFPKQGKYELTLEGDSLESPITKTIYVGLLKKVATGHNHTIGLTPDGFVYAWGGNWYGKLGIGENRNEGTEGIDAYLPELVLGLENIKNVVAGRNHSLALADGGEVYSWGDNGYGQLGLADKNDDDKISPNLANFKAIPELIKDFTNVKNIFAGDDHSFALMENGDIYAWGNNENGQLGLGDNGYLTSRARPVINNTLSADKIVSLVAGGGYSLALTDSGNVYAWGYDGNGRLGLGNVKKINKPIIIDKDKFRGIKINAIAAGSRHSVAVTGDRGVFTWGANDSGQLGIGASDDKFTPQYLNLNHVQSVSAGDYHTIALSDKGEVCVWGSNINGQLGTGSFELLINQPYCIDKSMFGDSKIGSIHAGNYYNVAITEEGIAYVWGENSNGQLGFTNKNRAIPHYIDKLSFGGENVASISAGLNHNLAITHNGSVYIWGGNVAGLFGEDNNVLDKLTPLLIDKSNFHDKKVSAVAAAASHSLAVTNDGEVYSFGFGDRGQLGLGDIEMAKVPTLIDKTRFGNEKVESVSAVYDHNLAVNEQGEVYAWGKNDYGQLGLGDMGSEKFRATPQLIDKARFNGNKITQTAVGLYHSLALTENGEVYIWGSNEHSALGIDEVEPKPTPQLINKAYFGGVKVISISARRSSNLVLTKNGDVYFWGWDGLMDLDEDGRVIGGRDKPKRIATLQNIVAISSSAGHSLSLNKSGELFSWGDNIDGALGLGSWGEGEGRVTPELVTNAKSIKNIANVVAGGNHSFIITKDGLVYAWGDTNLSGLGHMTSKRVPTLMKKYVK